MKFSIVLPVYNGERFIEKTIKSVLNQTYRDFELLIVNDLSTDETENIILNNFHDKIEEGMIKYYKNIKNFERSKSRNIGIDHAVGEIIAFIDADDFWHNNHLLNAYNFFNINNIDIYYNFPKLVDIHGIEIENQSDEVTQHLPVDEMVSIPILPYPSSLFIKAEALKRCGFFDDALSQREDWEIVARLFFKFNCTMKVGKELATVSIVKHDANTSVSSSFYKGTVQVGKLIEGYIKQSKIDKKKQNHLLKNVYIQVSNVAFNYYDLANGWLYFYKSSSFVNMRAILRALYKSSFYYFMKK